MNHMNMTMDNNFYSLFSAYWWLLFPLGWAIFRMVRLSMEHLRAEKALDLIKTYADQGKEVPPELLKILQQPEKKNRSPQDQARSWTLAGSVLAAAAVAFGVLLALKGLTEHDRDMIAGMSFLVAMLAGLAAVFLVAGYVRSKDNSHP
jgi:hypothetical protein